MFLWSLIRDFISDKFILFFFWFFESDLFIWINFLKMYFCLLKGILVLLFFIDIIILEFLLWIFINIFLLDGVNLIVLERRFSIIFLILLVL